MIRSQTTLAAALVLVLSPLFSLDALAQGGAALKLGNVGVLCGDVAHFKASLTGGAPGTPVDFFVDAAKIGRALTTADGSAILDWPLPEGITTGAHPIAAAVVPPGPARAEIRATASMDVIRTKTSLFVVLGQPKPLDPKGATYDVQVAATLYAETTKRHAIAKPVSVTFRGQKKTITTNASQTMAQAVFTVGPDGYGKPAFGEVVFEGDAHYQATSAKTDTQTLITPASQAPKFSYSLSTKSSKPIQLGDTVDVLVALLKPDKQPLANATLWLYAENLYGYTSQNGTPRLDFGKVTTGPDGKAWAHFVHTKAVPVGNYPLKLAYDLNGEMLVPAWPADFAGQVVVEKTILEMTVLPPAPAAPGANATVKVRVVRKADGKPCWGRVRIYEGSPSPNATMLDQQTASESSDAVFQVPIPAGAPAGPRPYFASIILAIDEPFVAPGDKPFTISIVPLARKL